MALDFRRAPMDLFHMPSVHPGMYYLPPRPGWVMRPVPSANIRMFAASDSDTIYELQQSGIDRQERRLLGSVMEVNSSPVVLTHVEFRNSFAMIEDRLWLNGAAGERLRGKFDSQNSEKWRGERLALAFKRMQNGPSYQPPVWKEPSNDLDIAIELKNGFNYYHFTTETFGSLAYFADDDSGRPINLHLPKDDVRGFLGRFIAAVFPAIAPRVNFVSASHKYDAVRAVYSHRHYLYQVHDERIAAAAADALEPRWQALRSDTLNRKAVAMASFDSSLRMLREHALRQVPQAMVNGLPKLVWMGRDEKGDARARGLTGERPLIEALTERGFEVVIFEHLTPLEQIAAMQAADILIAPHGAGLANMAYSRPDSLVIEIGTRQTQMHRWGDFLALAHVSRCSYDTVFADIAGVSNPDEVPPMSDGHMGIHIGKRATDRILQIVDKDLQRRRRKAAAAASVG